MLPWASAPLATSRTEHLGALTFQPWLDRPTLPLPHWSAGCLITYFFILEIKSPD